MEEQIVQNLKQNLPKPEESTPPPPPVPGDSGQAKTAEDYGLDEMTLYKLKDYFSDKNLDIEQLKYVYSEIAGQVGSDYILIMDRIRELEDVMSIRHNESRVFKLYQWLKLDTMRRRTEREMSYLRG